MNKTLHENISSLGSLVETQKNCISWGDPSADYMHGMANGMILAQSIFINVKPNFISSPRKIKRKNKIRHKGKK